MSRLGLLSLLIENENTAITSPHWKPTEAYPGTVEKMEVISDRIRRGLPLFHPDDRGTRDLRWHHDIDGE